MLFRARQPVVPTARLITRLLSHLALGLALLLPGGAARAQKLVMWMVGDDKVVRLMRPAVALFERRHPGVHVELRDVPWADAVTKYSAALASRTGPDLITGGPSYALDLGDKGALVDLNRVAPDLVRMLEQHAHPGALRAVRRHDGVMYAAPFDMHVQLQYYRTDLLPRAPATWDEFDAAVQRLRASGTRGFAQQWGNTGWLGFTPYLLQAGGALYDAQCTRALVDSPQAVRALNYYAGFYRRHHAPTDAWPDADGGLESGAYPLIQSGTWQLTNLVVARREIEGRWAAAPLPAGPSGRRTAFLGGSVIGITSFSRQVPLALDLLRSIYEPAVALEMAESALRLGLMWLPAGRQDQLGALSLPPQRLQAVLAQLQDAEGAPNCRGWQRMGDVLTRAVQRVVLADGDAQTELGRAAAQMNRALRVR